MFFYRWQAAEKDNQRLQLQLVKAEQEVWYGMGKTSCYSIVGECGGVGAKPFFSGAEHFGRLFVRILLIKTIKQSFLKQMEITKIPI